MDTTNNHCMPQTPLQRSFPTADNRPPTTTGANNLTRGLVGTMGSSVTGYRFFLPSQNDLLPFREKPSPPAHPGPPQWDLFGYFCALGGGGDANVKLMSVKTGGEGAGRGPTALTRSLTTPPPHRLPGGQPGRKEMNNWALTLFACCGGCEEVVCVARGWRLALRRDG